MSESEDEQLPKELPNTGQLHNIDILIEVVRDLREDILAYRDQAKLLVRKRDRLYRLITACTLVVVLVIGSSTAVYLHSRTVALQGVVEEACERHREVRDVFVTLLDDLLVNPRTSESAEALSGARDKLQEDPCPTEDEEL